MNMCSSIGTPPAQPLATNVAVAMPPIDANRKTLMTNDRRHSHQPTHGNCRLLRMSARVLFDDRQECCGAGLLSSLFCPACLSSHG